MLSIAEERELPLVLVLVRVGNRRPGLDGPDPIDRPGLEEERFDERRLSRPAVADDGASRMLAARAWAVSPPGFDSRPTAQSAVIGRLRTRDVDPAHSEPLEMILKTLWTAATGCIVVAQLQPATRA
jgi:hypothetical protein